MSTVKKVLFYLLSLFVYFLPSFIFRSDNKFYDSLNGQFVPGFVFIIVWSVIYLIIAFINTYLFSNRKSYAKKEFRTYFIFNR